MILKQLKMPNAIKMKSRNICTFALSTPQIDLDITFKLTKFDTMCSLEISFEYS